MVKEVFTVTAQQCPRQCHIPLYSKQETISEVLWHLTKAIQLSALGMLLYSPNLDKSSNRFSENSLEYMSESIEM